MQNPIGEADLEWILHRNCEGTEQLRTGLKSGFLTLARYLCDFLLANIRSGVMQMNNKNIYDTGLYLRLSRDDADVDGSKKTESNSISSQRDILRAYVQSHEDLQIYDIYIDDGYSGANFVEVR